MHTLIHILINSTSLYLLYKFAFSKSTRFVLNRLYLLSAVPLSVLLTYIPWPGEVHPQATILLNELVVTLAETPAGNFLGTDLAALLYSVVSMVLFLRMLISLIQLYRIKQQSIPEKGIHFTRKNHGVFSFLNTIYAYSGIPEAHLKMMIAHEKVHINKRHSLDIIYYELVCIFFWILPTCWLLKRELIQVHEFEADAGTVSTDNKVQYCDLLIKDAMHVSNAQLIHLFNNESTLKTRIMMLTTHNNTPAWRYAYILPMLLVLTILSANPVKLLAQDTRQKETKTTPEKMPEFPGGQEALITFLSSKLVYPAEAKDAKAEGKAVVEFMVNKAGKLKDITVVKSSGNKQLDNEAIRVIKMMPDWTPAEQGGKRVATKMALPIVFKL